MVSEVTASLTQPVSTAGGDATAPESRLPSALPAAEVAAKFRGGPRPAAGNLHRKSMSWAAGLEPGSPARERREESPLPGLSESPLPAVDSFGSRGLLHLPAAPHPALASWPPRQQQQPFVPPPVPAPPPRQQQPFTSPPASPPLPRTHTISVTSTLPGTMTPPPRSGWVRPASPPAAGAAVPLAPAAPPPAAAAESSSVPGGQLVPLGIITMEDVIEEMMQVGSMQD